jgi:hypothetical protein
MGITDPQSGEQLLPSALVETLVSFEGTSEITGV